jgi:ABC-2 type transport system permease protein
MSAVTELRHQRPSVVGTDLRRFLHLTWMLASTDYKLRFYGSMLGYVWMLARPFLLFGVIYFVFSEVAGLDAEVEHYGVYILFALVLFQFFSESTSGCVQSLIVRESLLRKVHFPRLVIPLSVVMTALLNLGATLVAVVIFALATGVYPTWSWLELPVIIGLVALFATGVGMLLAALYVPFRDVQPIWDVFTQLLFYGSPILYVATHVPAQFLDAYMINPLAVLLTEMRASVIDTDAPHPWDIAGPELLLIPAAIVLGSVVLGLYTFNRQAPRIAEEL